MAQPLEVELQVEHHLINLGHTKHTGSALYEQARHEQQRTIGDGLALRGELSGGWCAAAQLGSVGHGQGAARGQQPRGQAAVHLAPVHAVAKAQAGCRGLAQGRRAAQRAHGDAAHISSHSSAPSQQGIAIIRQCAFSPKQKA